MKVLLVNGSPHRHGCTDMALQETAKELEKQGIHTEIFWVGAKPISGCMGCGACKKGLGKCVVEDTVNQFTALAAQADGFIFGSPVHYAAISGAMTSFMDRAFYSGGQHLAGKPAAAVVSCRRGGASAAFDQMNKYFTISSMPVVSSQYWNAVHGDKPEEVLADLEGMQTLRLMADNMAWLLNCRQTSGLAPYERETRVKTNFYKPGN